MRTIEIERAEGRGKKRRKRKAHVVVEFRINRSATAQRETPNDEQQDSRDQADAS